MGFCVADCGPPPPREGYQAGRRSVIRISHRIYERQHLGRELHRISGVDLTRIDGIDVDVAQTVLSEAGTAMTRWKTEAHFASWLGLCPDSRITGGKVIRKSPVWCIACSSGGTSTSAKARNTTSSVTANNKCHCSKNERSSWGCRSSNPTLLDLVRRGFWRGGKSAVSRSLRRYAGRCRITRHHS